ncbi:MAG: FHA domain-containing protein [Myxococcota bacterium]
MTAWKLIIEDDAGKTIVVPLTRDEITIGRKEGNTIRLTERNVSRHHARLLRQNGHVYIQDCESYTGLRVNGDRIRDAVEVHEGDLIEIGGYHLALQSEEAESGLGGGPMPGSAVAGIFGDESLQDDFSGDTQRWEPPVEGDVAALPTLPPTELEPIPTEHLPLPVFASSVVDHAPAPQDVGPLLEPTPPPDEVQAFSVSSFNPLEADGAGETLRLPAASGFPEEPLPPPTLSATPSVSRPPSVAEPEVTEAVRIAPAARGAHDGYRFVVLNTEFAGTVLRLVGDELILGRTEENQLVLQHKSVSRHHVKFVREGERYRMHDLGSANGVLVNDVEAATTLLSSGDVLELGRVRLRFVVPGEHFSLSPEEVMRARQTEVSHDDDAKESRVGNLAQHPRRPSVLNLSLLFVVVLLVIIVIMLLVRQPTTSPPESTADAPATRSPIGDSPRRTEVAAARLAEATSYLEQGQIELARRAAQEAIELGAGAPAETLVAKAEEALAATASIATARTHLENGAFEDALEIAGRLAAGPSAGEAKVIEETARKQLIEFYEGEAESAHNEDRFPDRARALAALRRHDPARAQGLEERYQAEDQDSPAEVAVRAAARRSPKRAQARPGPRVGAAGDLAAAEQLERQATQALFTGNAAAAVKFLEEARAAAPERASVYRGLGQSYEKLGNERKATKFYQEYLRRSPGAQDRDVVKRRLQELTGT